MEKNVRIFTGSYDSCKSGILVSISGDKGKSVGFEGRAYTKLAPKREFWNKWHDNIGKISQDENNRYYMEQFYEKVLLPLNPEDVVKELQMFGEYIVLLCFEREQDFCHRQLVATWLERKLQIKVPEISIDVEGNVRVLDRNQKYVNEFNSVMDLVDSKRRGE